MITQSFNPSIPQSMVIIPSHYNCTVAELVEAANQLAMSPEILQSPFRRSRFSFRKLFHAPHNPSVPQSFNPSVRIRIHPHGHTPEQRLHSLMFFFHCLGMSKNN